MFDYKGIKDYHQQLTNKTTSCLEAVDFYLDQIKNKKHLNAFVTVFAETARESAQKLDRRRAEGKPMKCLHGVVIGIKDVICYQDHPVSAASKMLEGFHSLYTATAVKYLIEEEAIIIGSCNCDEFAMGSSNENSYYGSVINGVGENMVPGGSSGGSAVAVQTGQCMVSLGSDTGGSVRQPADFCGIIGLKPGYGMVSRFGLIAYASSFDQIGIFGKSVDDVALVFDIISKPDKQDTTMNQTTISSTILHEKPVFGYFREMLEHPSLDKEIKAAIKQKITALVNAGYEIRACEFPLIDYIVPAYYVLTTAEASSNLSRFDGIRYGYRDEVKGEDLVSFYKRNRSAGFGKEVKKRIMLGSFVLSSGFYDAYYQKAQQVRRILKEHIEQIFQEVNFIVLPNSPTTAYPLGTSAKDPVAVYLADIFTVYANLVGVPAIAIPGFKHSNNMPFGLQIITRRGDDVNLLKVSKTLLQIDQHQETY